MNKKINATMAIVMVIIVAVFAGGIICFNAVLNNQYTTHQTQMVTTKFTSNGQQAKNNILSNNYDILQKEKEKVHLAYSDINGHVIYDGKDMGIGSNIKTSGEHLGFVREVNGTLHFIYDGYDLGQLGDKNIDTRIAWAYFDISGDNYIFNRVVGSASHTFYNGQDLGVTEGFKISGNDYAIAKKVNNTFHLIYNGEDLGKLYDQKNKEAGMGSIHYSFSLAGGNIFYINPALHLYRNKTEIGIVPYDIFRGYESGYNLIDLGEFSASADSYCFTDKSEHIIFNGKDLGLGSDCRVSTIDFAYIELSASSNSIDYNGEKNGSGKNVVMKDNNIVFTRSVAGKDHIIFNGKDMGEGFFPTNESGINENNLISGNNVVFLRENTDHSTNVIYNGKDMGPGDFPQIAGDSLAYMKNAGGESKLAFNGTVIGNIGSSDYILSLADAADKKVQGSYLIIKDDSFVKKYGQYPSESFKKNTSILKSLQQLDKHFPEYAMDTAGANKVVTFADGRKILVLEGCTPHDCGGSNMMALYDPMSGRIYLGTTTYILDPSSSSSMGNDATTVLLGDPDPLVLKYLSDNYHP